MPFAPLLFIRAEYVKSPNLSVRLFIGECLKCFITTYRTNTSTAGSAKLLNAVKTALTEGVTTARAD